MPQVTPAQLYTIGRALGLAGWRWETFRGSLADGDAKGWWILDGAHDVRGMRRGDPKAYDQATLTTHELYQLEA